MRKIEQQMIEAIKANKNWKGGNTEVDVMWDSPCKIRTNIYLHGNHIAIVHQDRKFGLIYGQPWEVIPMRRTFHDWPTPTTRSRLRALGIDASIKNGCATLDGEEV
jgi:hypothetical protein